MGVLKGKATGSGGLDEAALRNALPVLADPSAGFQLHGLPSGRFRTAAGGDLDTMLVAARELSSDRNLYYSLNPVPFGLDHSARVADVLSRRWLLTDLDPLKPEEFADDPATDEEHRLVAEVAQEVTDHLGDRGWPLPLLIDSGNGYHLLYRIDLPNSPHAKLLVKGCLAALAPLERGRAKVGVECHDARRIAKLPGSTARKGTARPDRPFRPVRLLQVPDPLEVVSVELLEALAATVRPPPGPAIPEGKRLPAPGTSSNDRWASLKSRVEGSAGKRYARSALEREVQRILTARPNTPEGRNNCLNRAAYALGGFIDAGLLTASEVEARLTQAARDAGLGDLEIGQTFASGFNAGVAAPRVVPERNGHHPGAAKPSTNGKTHEPPEGAPVTVRASEILPKKIEWLWPNRVPLGKLTTFAGIGGLGKTFVLLDMAARVSRGLAWPDGTPCPDGEVLFVSGEDDPDDTLVPRLIELGADLNRVRFLRTHALDRFSLADLPLLERAAEECEGPLRLVVIDPPTAYLGGVDDHKNAELRGLLNPLKSWTQDRHAGMIFNTHVNKNTQKVEAMARVMGSVAWVNAVRAAHLFARDPDDDDRVLFVPMKFNLSRRVKALAYKIVETNDLARIEWLGEVDTTADRAINQASKPRKVVASEWLVDLFREKREWPSDELFRAAKEAGLSRNAIFEAKDVLSLPKARQRIGEDGSKTWIWWVPENWDRLSAPDHCPAPSEKRDSGTLGTEGDHNSPSGKDFATDPPVSHGEEDGGTLADIPW